MDKEKTADVKTKRRVAIPKLPILQAILVRLLLFLHSIVAIWRAATVDDNWWWLLMFVNVALFVEAGFTLYKRNGIEYKWFCPCFLVYLGTAVPAIWVLELDRVDRYEELAKNDSITEELSEIYGIRIPIQLSPDTWVLAIEQLGLFLMVLGRWLLPRGKVTRAELSTLLFVYIGITSDIMEIFQLFDEPEVRNDRPLTYGILAGWTASLIPFTLVLTAVRIRWESLPVDRHSAKKVKGRKLNKLIDTEMWSLLVFLFLQDGPFFVIRIYSLVVHKLFVSSIFFFLCKNTLFIASIIYRIGVICTEEVDIPRTVSYAGTDQSALNTISGSGMITSESDISVSKQSLDSQL